MKRFGTVTGAVRRTRAWQREGHQVVTTNGCFDLLHPGHIRVLEAAAKEGNRLVVLINTDKSVRRLKGSTRPVQTQEDRMTVLAALRCVDYVCCFDEPTPVAILERIRPDVHVKGGDYCQDDMPETETVIRHGGRIKLIPLVKGKSTSALVRQMKK